LNLESIHRGGDSAKNTSETQPQQIQQPPDTLYITDDLNGTSTAAEGLYIARSSQSSGSSRTSDSRHHVPAHRGHSAGSRSRLCCRRNGRRLLLPFCVFAARCVGLDGRVDVADGFASMAEHSFGRCLLAAAQIQPPDFRGATRGSLLGSLEHLFGGLWTSDPLLLLLVTSVAGVKNVLHFPLSRVHESAQRFLWLFWSLLWSTSQPASTTGGSAMADLIVLD
jgi:hypothetical protein